MSCRDQTWGKQNDLWWKKLMILVLPATGATFPKTSSENEVEFDVSFPPTFLQKCRVLLDPSESPNTTWMWTAWRQHNKTGFIPFLGFLIWETNPPFHHLIHFTRRTLALKRCSFIFSIPPGWLKICQWSVFYPREHVLEPSAVVHVYMYIKASGQTSFRVTHIPLAQNRLGSSHRLNQTYK